MMKGSAFLTVALTAALFVTAAGAGRRFYDDDPIAREPDSQDASRAEPVDVGLLFDLTYDLFVTGKREPSNSRARNINTIDEVPDSSWFTNRVGARTVTAAELARGPALGTPPAPERWVIIREKTAGVNPGFTARDANGETWFLSFDAPESPDGSTAEVVVASKLFWALGYNQVEMFLTTFDPGRVVIDPSATKRRRSGERTAFTRHDLDEMLERAGRNPDGTYRAAAGRLLPGKVLGGFRYEGTRPDDPNDIVAHEHRRELRALHVFGAWTNLTDLRASNTLDTVIAENGRSVVKHYLQDVGSTFGMSNRPHDWSFGWEYLFDPDASRDRLLSFGFALRPWQTVPYPENRSIGHFEGDHFDPRTWKPQTPNAAYLELRADDAFWAARRVMAFSDDLIRAAVETAQYRDPAAPLHLASVLIKRRDAIGRAYLTTINPIVEPRLNAAGTLVFENAATSAGFAAPPAGYRAAWSRFDNTTGGTTPIGESRSSGMTLNPPGPLPDAIDTFIAIDIAAEGAAEPAWTRPIRTFFRRTSGGWKLVGLERLSDKTAANPNVETGGEP
jgi:hypothetical protein